MTTATTSPSPRGAFVCLEGIDHCGKTTQAALLCKVLGLRGVLATVTRFPDRTTPCGCLINEFLARAADVDDRAMHLVYAANRWERAADIRGLLVTGTTVIADRYSYSGVAYTAAKGYAVDWCRAPEAGLPQPDLVLYLSMPVDRAMARFTPAEPRERYEHSEFLGRVAAVYNSGDLRAPGDNWCTIDADREMPVVLADLVAPTLAAVTHARFAPIEVFR